MQRPAPASLRLPASGIWVAASHGGSRPAGGGPDHRDWGFLPSVHALRCPVALSTARTRPKFGLGFSSTELKQPARATQ
jgi:hypothetical protein